MPWRRIDGVAANIPEVMMHLNGWGVAITGALLLRTTLGFGWAQGMDLHAGRSPIETHGVQGPLGCTDSPLAYLGARPE